MLFYGDRSAPRPERADGGGGEDGGAAPQQAARARARRGREWKAPEQCNAQGLFAPASVSRAEAGRLREEARAAGGLGFVVLRLRGGAEGLGCPNAR
jgi:hypothetical protein